MRESTGLEINPLALKSGVNTSNISRLEKRTRKDPTVETVKNDRQRLVFQFLIFDTVAAHIDDDVSEDEMKDTIFY